MQVKILPNKSIGVSEIGTPKIIKNTQQLQHTIKLISNKKQIQFQFQTSKQDYLNSKNLMSKNDLLESVFFFLNNVSTHINNYDALDFASEFGFSLNTPQDRENVRKVWKSLSNQHTKAKKLGLSDDDVFDALNYMVDHYNI